MCECAPPRAHVGMRAILWAILQLHIAGANISCLARQLSTGVEYHVVLNQPLFQAATDGPDRFAGVWLLGVDEHVWHHQNRHRRGPMGSPVSKLTRGETTPRTDCWTWCREGRAPCTRTGWPSADKTSVRGCESEAGSLPGTARTPSLGLLQGRNQRTQRLSHRLTRRGRSREGRCRVQQDTTGHRGRKGDPLYHIRLLLRASSPRANKNDSVRPSRQMRHTSSVEVAYHCAQQVRDVFHQATPAHGRRLATHLMKRLPTCPIPETAHLDRTLRT